jgi:hypothetical protein
MDENYLTRINYSNPSSLLKELETQRRKLAIESLRLGFGLSTYFPSGEIKVIPFGKEIGEI